MEKVSSSAVLFLFAASVLVGGVLFPYRASLDVFSFQLTVLPATMVYLAVTYWFFSTRRLPFIGSKAAFNREPGARTLLLTSVMFCMFSVGIMLFSTRMFAQFGYSLTIQRAAGLLAVLIVVSLILFRFRDGRYLPYFPVIAVLSLQLTSIDAFPLHPARSDMLLLIKAALERFVRGEGAYVDYVIHVPVKLTYLPGMWLSYLPAYLLKLDLRVTNALLLAVSAFILIHQALSSQRTAFASFAAVFFLNPWLTFRHDIYMPVFIFQMVVCLTLILKHRYLWAAVIFGIVTATYQFGWIIYPLFLILIGNRHGWKLAGKYALVTLAVAAAMITPFLLQSPEGFFSGVFGTWRSVIQIETMNLSYWVLRLIPVNWIKVFQVLCLLSVYAAGYARLKTIGGLMVFSTITSLIFIMTGQLIWHYFFLMPPIYMLVYLRVSPPSGP